VRTSARSNAHVVTGLSLHASDRDAGAVERTRANAERAGVAAHVIAARAAVSDAPFLSDGAAPPESGAVVTNPPYGKRLDSGPLRALYQTFGRRVATLPPGWRVAFLAADRKLGHATGLRLATAFLTDHGGVRVRALVRRAEGDVDQSDGS
jgi:putative N6-adenine-specific DNA methylase